MATIEIIGSLFPIEALKQFDHVFEDDDSLWDELDPGSAPAAKESPIAKRLQELKNEVKTPSSPIKRYKVDTMMVNLIRLWDRVENPKEFF
jgi:hypothetical protein